MVQDEREESHGEQRKGIQVKEHCPDPLKVESSLKEVTNSKILITLTLRGSLPCPSSGELQPRPPPDFTCPLFPNLPNSTGLQVTSEMNQHNATEGLHHLSTRAQHVLGSTGKNAWSLPRAQQCRDSWSHGAFGLQNKATPCDHIWLYSIGPKCLLLNWMLQF